MATCTFCKSKARCYVSVPIAGVPTSLSCNTCASRPAKELLATLKEKNLPYLLTAQEHRDMSVAGTLPDWAMRG